MVNITRVWLITLLSTTTCALADQVINDDLVVFGSACVGSGCTDGYEFEYDTLVVNGNEPSILFHDTSASSSFPTVDWSLSNADGQFSISNETTNTYVMQISENGNSLSLGSGSTLVTGALSVGTETDLRRVVNLADGVAASDAATYGQLQTAVNASNASNQERFDAADTANTANAIQISNLTSNVAANSASISANTQALGSLNDAVSANSDALSQNAAAIENHEIRITQLEQLEEQVSANSISISELGNELDQIGAMSSALSSLSSLPNPAFDNSFSVGIGGFGDTTALAIGTYHYVHGDQVLLNTSAALAHGKGAKPSYGFGISFGL